MVGMKREPGENPGHYPMLLAPQKAFLLPVSHCPDEGREGRRRVEQVRRPAFVFNPGPDSYRDGMLIAAFGTKSTGEIKAASTPVFFCI